MPRPNPPRKRPRRRPDAVERSARAEVSLAKQTAQVKGSNGSADGKRQSNAKSQPVAKGAAGARGRRIDEPYVPWAKRSYLVLVAVLFVAELVIGGFYYLTIQSSKPPPPPFDIFLLAVSYQPLLPVAAALVAAPIAKFITKEPRSLRFMELIIVGIVQYFVWLSLFVALTYIIGGFNSATTTSAATSATTAADHRAGGDRHPQLRRRVLRLSAALQVHAPPPAATHPKTEQRKAGQCEARGRAARQDIDRRQDGRGIGTRRGGEGPERVSAAFGEVRSLYLHIPFCERKCEYCDFTSVAGTTGSEQYMEALCTEVRRLGERLGRLTLDTVFIGGGTPSLVEPALLAELVATVRRTFSVAPGAEVTMEANPSSITTARARVWKEAGVNRISIGVQSLEADALRFLGRVHDADRAIAASRRGARGGLHLDQLRPHLRGARASATRAGGERSSASRRPVPRTSPATSSPSSPARRCTPASGAAW